MDKYTNFDTNFQSGRMVNSQYLNGPQFGQSAPNSNYVSNFTYKQPEFHFNPQEFPPLHGTSSNFPNNTSSINDISLVLKNIQQEIQMLKQYRFDSKEPQNVGDIVTNFPNPENAKNILPQPVRYGQ